VTQEEGPLEIEIGDSGIQPNLLPGVPSGWTDALTGTDGPRLWDRTVSSEVARVSRYRRPVTVALIEINGLDRYARSWGIDVAERLFVQLARTMAVNVRSSDHMARVERTRFGLLLTETDEIAAIKSRYEALKKRYIVLRQEATMIQPASTTPPPSAKK